MPGPVLLLYCAGWGCQPGWVRPRIRYTSTPAGRVAYSTTGAGPALLCDSGWITHLRAQLELYSFGSFIERLAVADVVGADRFSLFGASQGGQLATAIAARYPERVEALVVYGMCASGRDLAPAEVRESLVALVRAHWGLGLKALTGTFVTDPTAEELAGFNGFQRSCASATVAARLL